jgi:serine/threonine protein kinase
MVERANSLSEGERFARYVITQLIGRGGMADVYLASDSTLERDVALKVITSSVADSEEFRSRFAREQRAAAAVDHANILPVFEAGEERGMPYLATRYVAGGSLRALADREGPLPLLRIVGIVLQIAAGLDAAHVRGFVHRDVKPENVLIALEGERDHAYITDFGIAKLADRYAGTLDTQPGMTVGTPSYMAPEQAMGQAVDARTDVYALGVLTFFLLTGREPFQGDSPVAVLLAHVNDAPPRPSALARSLPLEVDAVIDRALAKAPEDRYPSAGAFARELADAVEPAHAPIAAAEPPVAPPPPLAPAPAPVPEPLGQDATATVRIALQPGFRFVHQPLVEDDGPIRLLGNDEAVRALVQRISYSSGGSFLITGFRGVGKSTVIARALRDLLATGEDVTVLPVSLNVARPKTVEVLLFEVIRRLFETLKDQGLLERMSPMVQRELILAYWRTSMSFNETRSKSVEHGGGVRLGAPPGLLEALGPKLELSRKATNSLATQASFLAYTEADVEHDFLRILSLLGREELPERLGWWHRLRHGGGEDVQHWRGKLVVVIDELDKLTLQENGMDCIQELLSGLKNLLTAQGVHFLFVAGPDLHDVALRESLRGTSVYESVFGWQLYVPCLWDATEQLLDDVVDPDARDHRELDAVTNYLSFKSRGVPRLLLMELNSFVRWVDGRAELELGASDLARVQFYAGLEQLLTEFLKDAPGSAPFGIRLDEDRWRLGAHYVTDWILRSEGTFTVEDLVSSEARADLDPLLSLSARKVTDLLQHLRRHEIVEEVRGSSPDQTYYGDVPTAQTPVYRLAAEVERKLAGFASVNERERAELIGLDDATGLAAAGQPWADSGVGGTVAGGRYELLEELDRGGLGHVYRARSKFDGAEVAVKVFDLANVSGREVMRARLGRMGEIAVAARHPNIVRTLDVIDEEPGRLVLVMELVHGTPLQRILATVPLSPREAVALTRALADALEHLHQLGVARLDLKPQSILVAQSLHPILLDLGLAKVVRESELEGGEVLTAANAIIGTPAYAAPEQLRGEPADIRSDIYSLGLILFEALRGRAARRGDRGAVLHHALNETIDVDQLPGSAGLHAALRRATARDPDGRFETPAAFAAALAATPEAGSAERRADDSGFQTFAGGAG